MIDVNRALLDQVRIVRGKGVSTATLNRYMALVRTILRKACIEWEWMDRAPKVGMFRDAEGRIRSLSRDEFSRLQAELPRHLADMDQFSVATGLRQANVTRRNCNGSRSALSVITFGSLVTITKMAVLTLYRSMRLL